MRTNFFKKRLTTLLLSFATVVCNAYGFYSDGLIFYILSEEDKTVEVECHYSSYNNSRIDIPSTVEIEGTTYSVIRIADNAFSQCGKLTILTIPKSVTSIGNSAFNGCKSFTSFVVPEGVTSIGNYVFSDCYALQIVILPSTLTEIGTGNFSRSVAYYSSEPPAYPYGFGGETLYIPEGSKEAYSSRGYLSHFSSVKDILSYETPGWFMEWYLLYGYDGTSRQVESLYIDILLPLTYAETFYHERYNDESFWNKWAEWEQTYASLQAYYMTETTRSEVDDLTQRIENDTLQLAEQMRMLEDDYRDLNSLIPEWEKYTEELKELAAKYHDLARLNEQLDSLDNAPSTEEGEALRDSIYMTRGMIDYTKLNMAQCAAEYNELREKYPESMIYEMEDLVNRINGYGIKLESLAERLRTECSPQVVDDIRYQLMADTTATVVGYDGDDKHIVIRDSIAFDGLMFPVKKIGRGAFSGLNIESVDIPETVEEIEDEAFADCYLLVTIICRHRYFAPIIHANTFRGCGTHAPGYNSGINGGYGYTVYVYSDSYRYFTEDGHWKKIITITYQWSCYFTGYATVYTTIADLQIPDGIKAYTGVIRGDRVMLTEIEDKIPVGTPAIIYGKGGTYKFNFTTGAEPVGENDLKGTDEPLVADGTQYVLYEMERYGFYKVTPGTTIPAGKAYIEYSGAGVKGFIFGEDDATSINEELRVKNEESSVEIFSISGQRIQKMQKGINIVNGKKVLK